MAPTKTLSDLFHDLLPEGSKGLAAVESASSTEIIAVTADSRQVKAGALFVALVGERWDGHDFLEAVVMSGAAAVLVQEGKALPPLGNAIAIPVPDTRALWGPLTAAWAGPLPAPLSQRVAGVTGTNGKTTTSYLLEAILLQQGQRPGVLGTVSYRVGEHIIPAALTTPTPTLLWRTLSRMVKQQADAIVMEVSSHALHQYRVDGLPFQVAGFTNLSQDHLDYHESMEAYFNEKARLFEELLSSEGTAVINVDDDYGQQLVPRSRGEVWRYSTTPGTEAEIYIEAPDIGLHGIRAQVHTPKGSFLLESPMLGAFNLSNLLLASGMALALGVSPEGVAAGIKAMTGVPGRLEQVAHQLPFTVVVDYAHTPDALKNVLATLRPLCEGRLIVAFGCGGDRDQRKRPLMGAAVAERADLAIVTSDNPRTEEPDAIVAQILPGLDPVMTLCTNPTAPDATGYLVEVDRGLAIAQAIQLARDGDIVVIAGKGHEDYQIIGETRYPFDDRVIAARALHDREPGCVAEASMRQRDAVEGAMPRPS